MVRKVLNLFGSKHCRFAVIIAAAVGTLLPAAAAENSAASADPANPDCTPTKTIPRPSPVVLANVLYTAFPGGSALDSKDAPYRGRMTAVRIYDPEDPEQTLTGDQTLWEAGQVTAAADPKRRRILFADGGGLKPFSAQIVTPQMLGLDDSAAGSSGSHGDFNRDGEIDGSDAAWLVDWVRGGRQTGAGGKNGWPLGAVDRSVPALMVPPEETAGMSIFREDEQERTGYLRFSAENRERPTVLFVGAADGMLHAFDAGSFRRGDNPATADIEEQRGYFRREPQPEDPPDYCFDYDGNCPNYGTGKELWAFIPANLLPRLKYRLLGGGDPADMNTSPAIADAYLDRDRDGTADTWRTVLVSAQGSGGDGVFCLDVTDPQRPALLWETTAAELVRRRAPPAVVRVGRILDGDTGRPRWVAFLASGTAGSAGRFPAVLVFDLSGGNLVQRILLDAAADLDGDGMLSPGEAEHGRGGVAGSRPAVVDADGNGFIDRIYVTSDKGLVYKIVLPDLPGTVHTEITHCVLNTDFSAADGSLLPAEGRFQPVNASPTVVVDRGDLPHGDGSGRVWVFFGTGGRAHNGSGQDRQGFAAVHHFFAYTDDAGGPGCSPQQHRLQWFVELPPGEQMTASAFAAAGRIYFATTASAGVDPCAGPSQQTENQGSLSAVDLEGIVLFRRSIPGVLGPPVVEDRHLYVPLPGGPVSIGSGIYNNAPHTFGRPQIRLNAWQQVE